MNVTQSHTRLPWSAYLAGSWLLVTLLFWWLNPSATQGYGVWLRLVFWAVHVGAALALLQIAQLALSRGARASEWSAIWQVTVAGCVGGIAFLPVAIGLDWVFPDFDLDAPQSALATLADELLTTLPPVVLVWIAINAPRLLYAPTNAPAVRDADQPSFLKKLPGVRGSDVAAISAELHYIRVRTAQTDALILYPFGKAVQEMPDGFGQQVHRSHWVAYRSIADLERRGEQAGAILNSGAVVPVSRRYRASLSSALDDRATSSVIRA